MESRSAIGWKLALLVLIAPLLPGLIILRFPAGTSTLGHADRLPAGAPRLLVSSSDGLLVVGERGVARITPGLDVRPLAWPAALAIKAARGVAWHRGRLYLAFEDEAGGHGVMAIADEHIAWLRRLPFAPHGLGVAGDRVVYFELHHEPVGPGVVQPWVTRHVADGADGPPVSHALPRGDVAPIGIVWRDETPLLVLWPAAERARWGLMALDGDGSVEELECGGVPWSPSLIGEDEGRHPGAYVDDGACRSWMAYGLPAFDVDERGRLAALSVDLRRGHSDAGRAGGASPRRVRWDAPFITVDGEVRAVDDSLGVFVAYPVGRAAMVLQLDPRARPAGFVLDAEGRRLDRGDARWAGLWVLAARNGGLWVALGLLLPSLALGLPPLLLWTLRRRRAQAQAPLPGARGLFVGTLCLPAGSLLGTIDGRAALPDGECSVRVGGQQVTLAPGMRRLGWLPQVPLIDGEPVYVLGRIESSDGEHRGGPFRSSERLRLVADEGTHAIGSGDAVTFGSALRRRAVALAVSLAAIQIIALLAFLVGLLGSAL